jgi:protein AbiQ
VGVVVPPYFCGVVMFSVEEDIKIVSIDVEYLKALHNADNEVQYNQTGYENKKFVGILINEDSVKYVIPLSSAKEKHKSFKDTGDTYLLIYEISELSEMGPNDIYVCIENSTTDGVQNVKHILSILDCKKMIPVVDEVYTIESIHPVKNDSIEVSKYKNLLEKEYSFCVTNKDKMITKANRLYIKQKRTGKVIPKCCNFKTLEKVAKDYSSK